MYFQDAGAGGVSFSAAGLIQNMGWPARIIAIILFIMSIWSLAVMIDRYLYFNAARKQSREFAPKVAGALKDGRLDEAIKLGDRSKKSHLAEVLNAFQAIATQKTSGIGAVAGGISEALVTTAFGLFVAIPAVMTFNFFTNKVEAFDVEMDNSSSELVDYFIKQSHR